MSMFRRLSFKLVTKVQLNKDEPMSICVYHITNTLHKDGEGQGFPTVFSIYPVPFENFRHMRSKDAFTILSVPQLSASCMSATSSSSSRLSLLLLFGIVTGIVAGRVRQVHVLTRHGAREHLHKTAAFEAPERGGLLTAQGEAQLVQLGEWLQMRYNNNNNSLSLIRVSSTATQRTMVSAMSLVRGYTNATNNTIPVYSTPEVHDIDIRAYDKCPTFSEHLESLYENDETWNNLEKSVEGILHRLATMDRYARYADTKKGMIPLENGWNVVDDIAVCETGGSTSAGRRTLEYCLRTSDTDDAPILSSSEWSALQTVIHKAELARYHTATAGDLIGRNLLLRIAQEERPGMFVYSGHYPTLLGVMAKMNIADYCSSSSPDNDDTDSNVIPSFASALLFEEQDDGKYEVYFKSGDSNQAVLLRQWDSRTNFVADVLLGKSGDDNDNEWYNWCRLCRNKSADVCLVAAVMMNDDDGPSLNSTVAGFLLGIILGALVVVAGRTFLRTSCRNRRRRLKPRDANTNIPSSWGQDNTHEIEAVGTTTAPSQHGATAA